jgi:hypothetical protein
MEKSSQKICSAYFSHFHTIAQSKHHPIGDNSPNLVTLIMVQMFDILLRPLWLIFLAISTLRFFRRFRTRLSKTKKKWLRKTRRTADICWWILVLQPNINTYVGQHSYINWRGCGALQLPVLYLGRCKCSGCKIGSRDRYYAFKHVLNKNLDKNGRFCLNYSYIGIKKDDNIGFKENRHFSAKHWRKSPKIMVITLTPRANPCKL